MELTQEQRLEQAAEALGKAMQSAPAEEKVILKAMYEKFSEMVKANPESGDQNDVSAHFALAIISNAKISSPAVVEAAVAYINEDLSYCRSRSKKA